jgi:hypothetical protein
MRTDWLCEQFDAMNIKYFRDPNMNIVTVEAKYIPQVLEAKYDLVPQKHDETNEWYKIVIMDHVEVDHLSTFIADLKSTLHAEKRTAPQV